MWMHRRSEEPEPTSIECYWKKPRLAQLDKNLSTIKAKDLCKIKNKNKQTSDSQIFFSSISEQLCFRKFDCPISRHLMKLNDKNELSIHQIMIRFLDSQKCTGVNNLCIMSYV